MYNVAIVEDSREATELLVSYFDKFAQETETKFSVVTFDDAFSFLENYSPVFNMVLMDINMPNMDGMEASHRLREIDTTVTLIFVTNMAQYAIRGYEVGAADFIVKPVHYYDFRLKLGRALSRIDMQNRQKISIKIDDSIKCVSAADIMYVEVSKHKLIYHLPDETLESYGTLKQAEEALRGCNFVRCNQCYLVNLSYVNGAKGFTVTVGSDELAISRSNKKSFFQALNRFLGRGGAAACNDTDRVLQIRSICVGTARCRKLVFVLATA